MVRRSLIFQRRVLRIRAPRELTFEVKWLPFLEQRRSPLPERPLPWECASHFEEHRKFSEFSLQKAFAVPQILKKILKTGCDVPETKLLFTMALHAIKGAVCGTQKLFDCRPIGRIDGDANAD